MESLLADDDRDNGLRKAGIKVKRNSYKSTRASLSADDCRVDGTSVTESSEGRGATTTSSSVGEEESSVDDNDSPTAVPQGRRGVAMGIKKTKSKVRNVFKVNKS